MFCKINKKFNSKFNKFPYLIIDDALPEINKNIDKIKKVVCETHGNPQKLKYFKNEKNQIQIRSKNNKFSHEYNKLISELKYRKLYGSWFIEWH